MQVQTGFALCAIEPSKQLLYPYANLSHLPDELACMWVTISPAGLPTCPTYAHPPSPSIREAAEEWVVIVADVLI